MDDRIFLGQFLPQDLIAKYGLSQAANNFCFKIVGLDSFSYCLSIPPLNVEDEIRITADIVDYYTFRMFPHRSVLKLFNLIFENIICYYKILKRREKKVWFYNVYKGNILAYYLLRLFSTKEIYVLLADYNPERMLFVFRKLIINALKSSKGIISLSERCSELNENFISIPGILNEQKLVKEKRPFKRFKRCLLSGTLNKNTGLDLAVEVFKRIPEVNLVLLGKIENNNSIVGIDNNSNIRFLNYLESYDEYLKLLNSVDFILSFRNPDAEVNKYNFPSKILEALSFNIPVISTMSYPELKDIAYFPVKYDVDTIVAFIRSLYGVAKDTEIENASDNFTKLRSYYTQRAWKNAIELIEYNSNN